jgi:hypothetical protein
MPKFYKMIEEKLIMNMLDGGFYMECLSLIGIRAAVSTQPALGKPHKGATNEKEKVIVYIK